MLDLGHSLELLGVVSWQLFYLLVRRNEVHLVLLTYNFAGELGLVVLLADVATLVVEEAVRVTHPGDAPKEHTTETES